VNRASLFASLEGLLDHAGDEQAERELGQASLFDSFSADEVKLVTPAAAIFKQEEDWPSSRKLALEKQTVGFYVSGHPMDTWQKICEEWLGWSTERVREYVKEKAAQKKPAAESQWEGGFGPGRFRAPKTEVRLGGLLCEMREVMTKKGTRMAFAHIEDLKGKLEVIFFPDAYGQLGETIKRALAEAEPIVLTGEIEIGEEAPKILAKSIEWAAEAHKNRVQRVILTLDPTAVKPEQLRELKKSLLNFRGRCPVKIQFTDPKFKTSLELPQTLQVTATPQMVKAVNAIFGRDVVTLG
jgi:DNA polymerase-3 subunit alpha